MPCAVQYMNRARARDEIILGERVLLLLSIVLFLFFFFITRVVERLLRMQRSASAERRRGSRGAASGGARALLLGLEAGAQCPHRPPPTARLSHVRRGAPFV